MRAFLRSAVLLRLKDRGSPSVASPFGGATVRRTVAEIRLTPGSRPTGALRVSKSAPGGFVMRALQSLHPMGAACAASNCAPGAIVRIDQPLIRVS